MATAELSDYLKAFALNVSFVFVNFVFVPIKCFGSFIMLKMLFNLKFFLFRWVKSVW